MGEDASAVVAGLQNNLRKLRLEAGLSQQALANRASVSRQAYAALEAGTANPSTELALRLARVLGMGVESIFFLPEDSPGPVEAELAGGALPPGPALEATPPGPAVPRGAAAVRPDVDGARQRQAIGHTGGGDRHRCGSRRQLSLGPTLR